MPRTMTLAELRDDNALTIVGTISGLLRRLARKAEAPDLRGIDKRYATEAMSGDYAHLCAVSERYALDYLRGTLDAHAGDLTDSDDDDDDPDDDLVPGVDTCLDCGRVNTARYLGDPECEC